jgi:hypothetical protein
MTRTGLENVNNRIGECGNKEGIRRKSLSTLYK